MSDLASIQQLWEEHLRRPFPDDLATQQVDGEDLVMLEADIAGCVATFLGGRRAPALDATRLRILSECAVSLSHICPQLPNEHRDYFETLRVVSEQVVRYGRRQLS